MLKYVQIDESSMPKYLDPKADIVFKKIFGDHPHLLKSLLNAVLPLEDDNPIVELEALPSEQVPEIPTFKRTIADVKCKDASGRIFIVEMQINWTDGFKQRLLFGASQAIVKQLTTGQDYQFLQPVYGLGLVADTYDHKSKDWYHHYQLVKNSNNNDDVIKQLQLVFIELPKFPIKSQEEKQLRLLWLRFLREINEQTIDAPAELMEVPEITEALHLAELSAYSPGELNAYETYWDNVSREKTLMSGKFNEGKKEGLKEGLEQGIEQGIEQGKEKAAIEIAKNSLKAGVSIPVISQITGLSIEEIERLG